MRHGTLERSTEKSGDAGTRGHIAILAKGSVDVVAFQCVAGELPPRDNHKDLSCIAPMPGEAPITYLFKWEYSEEHGCNNYRCVGVLLADGSVGPIPGGRTASEIHAANLFGDILKGEAAQLEGCVAPGAEFATFPKGQEFHTFTAASPEKLVLAPLAQDQVGVAASGPTLAALNAELAGEDLALTVSWV